jgi:hypothetical protein
MDFPQNVNWKAILEEMRAEILAAKANPQSRFVSAEHEAACGKAPNAFQQWLERDEDELRFP